MSKYSETRPKAIARPVVVLVEGEDYFHFLLKQIDGPKEFETVQLFNFLSNSGSLKEFLPLLKGLRGFDAVTAIGIINDAEDDADKIARYIKKTLRDNGLPSPELANSTALGPPKTGFLIIPHETPSGCLENAVLNSLAKNTFAACVETFAACVNRPERNDNWRAKVRVHAHIAASDKPSMTLGQSCLAGIWNEEHEDLRVMLDFIQLLTTA